MPWIKLHVGMFDGNSFKKIKKAKIGGESFRDKLTAVWFELLDFAGKCNAGGKLLESAEIPFTSIEDIALLIDREPEELELCMQYFINSHMVSVSNEVYMLTNWGKYQNEDSLAKIREQNRLRQKKWYDKQKALPNAKPNVNLTLSNAQEEEREEDKEKDTDIENERKNEEAQGPLIHSFDTDNLSSFSTEVSTKEDAKRKYMGGTLGKGVVLLSQVEIDELLDELSLDEFDRYVTIVADNELAGKHYRKKTHKQAILDMALQDRGVKL